MHKPLSQCHEGESVHIHKLNTSGALKKRLLEIGLYKGEMVTIIKYAPLKDPMEIQVRSTHISLRVKEAETILVTPGAAG
jgi:Fe2+ transport system protein FeoA